MVEESFPQLPPAEEFIDAKTDTALEPEPESGEPTPEPTSEPGFVCGCEKWMRTACTGLFRYKEHESQRYCVLHYPGEEKSADFKAAFDSKLSKKDFDFQGVWFPDEVHFTCFDFASAANFNSATFSGAASFSGATFSAAASFGNATFSGAVLFCDVTFSAAAYFLSATFNADADFSPTTFNGAAFFNLSVFHAQADFGGAFFSDSLHFFGSAKEELLNDDTRLAAMALGKDPSLDFQHVRIEHADRIAFHTLTLRPHWFVNVDSRQFVFTDVSWEWERISIKQEIAALEANGVSSPNRLLAIACHQLAENAETNYRYEEASNFRYWAMDLAKRTKWKARSFWKTDWLHMLYWAVSGYGERILRALGVLAAVWIVFVLLYTQVGFTKPESKSETPTANPAMAAEPDTIGQPLSLKRAWIYSLGVMSLQKPEPKPLTGTAQTLVLLETILGPVQAALLALAIRRKFMR